MIKLKTDRLAAVTKSIKEASRDYKTFADDFCVEESNKSFSIICDSGGGSGGDYGVEASDLSFSIGGGNFQDEVRGENIVSYDKDDYTDGSPLEEPPTKRVALLSSSSRDASDSGIPPMILKLLLLPMLLLRLQLPLSCCIVNPPLNLQKMALIDTGDKMKLEELTKMLVIIKKIFNAEMNIYYVRCSIPVRIWIMKQILVPPHLA